MCLLQNNILFVVTNHCFHARLAALLWLEFEYEKKKKTLKNKNRSWGLSHTVGYVNNNFVIGQTQRVSHEGHGAK